MPWSPSSRRTVSCAPGRLRMPGDDLAAELGGFLADHSAELIQFRRDLHAHPEIGYHEHRTTRRVALRLAAGGQRPMILPKGSGLMVEIGAPGADPEGPLVALRADLDALPIPDEKAVAYRSTVPNACHACGHDVHTTILLGAGLFLAAQALGAQAVVGTPQSLGGEEIGRASCRERVYGTVAGGGGVQLIAGSADELGGDSR